MIVPRTCTEIVTGDANRQQAREPQPLEAFRDVPAYVLLGDPGAGKTTAFKAECKTCTDGHRTSARRFIRGDLDAHPEWHGKTLFIDGLDEVRAGGDDPRNSLDQIITKLERLGKPPFRLSCRTFDWLGRNDHKELADVYQDVGLKILQLDSLEKSDIADILQARPNSIDAEAFMTKAQEQGVDGFLKNPQSLNLLADVVTQSGEWPKSRLELFEKACFQMAQELNDEHAHAAPTLAPGRLLDIAGRLCAIQLMTGTEGYTRHGQPDDDYPVLDLYSDGDPDRLWPALSTMLFEGASDNRSAPVHRHIAEFLGARYLAQVIGEGLPARRVIALITGTDGGVVTELRGLSAWLAAHCQEARTYLIERDPIGVGLYGDIRGFSLDEKRKLLASLEREGAWLDPWSDPRNDSLVASFRERASAFVAFVTTDMESVFREIMEDSNRDPNHQVFADFALRVLEQGAPMRCLSETLLDIVRDDTRWPRIKESALRAFIRHCPDSQDKVSKLKALLADIQTGRVSDFDDNRLLGILLTELYPDDVTPSEIWSHFAEQEALEPIGKLWWLWDIVDASSDEQVPALLDNLSQRFSELRPDLEIHHIGPLSLKLLARGLKTHGDRLDTARLYDWLVVGEGEDGYRSNSEAAQEVRSWLEQRPEVQKDLCLEGLRRWPDSDAFVPYIAHQRLYCATPPPAFGLWCLEQAVDRANTESPVGEYLLEMAFYWSGNEGLPLEVLREYAQKNERLAARLDEWVASRTRMKQMELEHRERGRTFTEEQRQREAERLAHIRSNESALRENRAAPALLHQLATAYFGVGFTSRGPTGVEEALRGDQRLTQAALQGFRGVVDRQDVPALEEILSLQAQGRTHYLAWPFLAGLAEIERTAPDNTAQWDDNRICKALAFYYRTPLSIAQPAWYQRLLVTRPELVADVLVQCDAAEFRRGQEYLLNFAHLNIIWEPDHAQVVRHASLRLLRAFPVRCRLAHFGTLANLLWAAIRYADRPAFLNLAERKLTRTSMNTSQRVYWLAAGLLTSPTTYKDKLERFTQDQRQWVLHFTDFLCRAPKHFLSNSLKTSQLEYLIRFVGRHVKPVDILSDRFYTSTGYASGLLKSLIQNLATFPAKAASDALASLLADPALSCWHDSLSQAQDAQRVIWRDASYRHPTIEQVCQTLKGGTPANPGDLAALVMDRLGELAVQIRKGNTDDWRQYWEGLRGQSPAPKHEDDCRDALLSDLQQCLPQGVDAQPEGHYVNDKRADIRVSYGGFEVPVEVKKNTHRDLWRAIRDQLMVRYASAPETDGYGIYLVFWFGKQYTQAPPSGHRPADTAELKKRLEETLSADEARKISVCVIDVSKP